MTYLPHQKGVKNSSSGYFDRHCFNYHLLQNLLCCLSVFWISSFCRKGYLNDRFCQTQSFCHQLVELLNDKLVSMHFLPNCIYLYQPIATASLKIQLWRRLSSKYQFLVMLIRNHGEHWTTDACAMVSMVYEFRTDCGHYSKHSSGCCRIFRQGGQDSSVS